MYLSCLFPLDNLENCDDYYYFFVFKDYFPFNIYFSESVCVVKNVKIIAKDDFNETRSTLGMGCSLIVIWRTYDFLTHWRLSNNQSINQSINQ